MKILYLLIATLKFLGIATLLLLLLLLFLVIIVLIVPIKYNVYVNKSDETYVYTTVKWLYSIVGMDIIYNNGSEITKRFKLFGIRINPRRPKKSKEPKEYKVIAKADEELDNPIAAEKIVRTPDKRDKSKKKKTKESQDKGSKTIKKKGGFKDTINQIQSFIYKRELLTDTLGWCGMIIKRIRPLTLYMEIEIGRENPADTGQLIGIISALYPLYYPYANIVGNYEKECFYVKLNAKGHLSLGKFVYDFIKYIRSTSVRQLIKFIREDRKGKKDGRKIRK